MPGSLTYSVQSTVVTPTTPVDLMGYRLVVTVTAFPGHDPRVFVFQRPTGGPGALDGDDTFYAVTSLAQLEFIPADDVAAGPAAPSGPFYRRASLDLVFGSVVDLTDALKDLRFCLERLSRAAVDMDALSVPEVTIV